MKSHEKIIETIRKLLRMSQDASSPNEAAIALKRARKIMDKHQISELEAHDSATDSGFDEQSSAREYKSMPRWQQGLALAIGNLNDVKVSFNFSSYSNGKRVRFSGYASDTITSVMMFEYLIETADRLAETVPGRRAKNIFKIGFVAGVKQQVKETIAERQKVVLSDGRSLILVKSTIVAQRFGRTRKQTCRTTIDAESADIFANGVLAGRNTSLNRQMTTEQKRALASALNYSSF